MGLFDLTQISLERALVGSAARQQVLANNISNANTPGFQRSDLDFHAALTSALQAKNGTETLSELGFEPAPDPSSPSRADGSNVDMELEMASLAENTLEYQALVGVAKARLRILETAIGGPR